MDGTNQRTATATAAWQLQGDATGEVRVGRSEVLFAPKLLPAVGTVLDVTVVLDVMRMPKTQIESPGDETEVNDRHATALMHYALFRAYSRPDPDSMDRVTMPASMASPSGIFRRSMMALTRSPAKMRISWSSRLR